MGDFLSAVFKPLESKLRSPLYMAFIFAFVVWNWDVFVTLFFVSNESIISLFQMTKSQYIHDVILWNKNWIVHMFGMSSWSFIFGYIFIFIWRYIIPVGVTYVVIKYLPHWGNWAHSEEKRFALMKDRKNLEYRRDKLDLDREILGDRKDEEKVSLEREKQIVELEQIKNQSLPIDTNQEGSHEEWDEEYKKIDLNILEILSRFIYYFRGDSKEMIRNDGSSFVKILSNLDAYGLIISSGTGFVITEKGRYFLKRLSLEDNR